MNSDRAELFSEIVLAGSRIYYFDVKKSQKGDTYLVISESRKTESGYEHDRVMIFEENIEVFRQGFEKSLTFLNLGNEPKAYDVDEVRRSHPKAYMKWSSDEDNSLRSNFLDGKNENELAMIFQRKPGAIRSRLKKLGLAQR